MIHILLLNCKASETLIGRWSWKLSGENVQAFERNISNVEIKRDLAMATQTLNKADNQGEMPLTLYQPMTAKAVMSSHKPIRICIEASILGVILEYRFCFLSRMVGVVYTIRLMDMVEEPIPLLACVVIISCPEFMMIDADVICNYDLGYWESEIKSDVLAYDTHNLTPGELRAGCRCNNNKRVWGYWMYALIGSRLYPVSLHFWCCSCDQCFMIVVFVEKGVGAFTELTVM